MIDHGALEAHLDDYAEVFGRTTNRFVCPITLRECDEPELINGHILNGALLSASRRQVIQYGKVDHFYGTRVEPELVKYLNLKDQSPTDLLRANKSLVVEFGDGTTARAFVTAGKAAKAASRKFPIIDARVADDKTVPVFVEVGLGDPRLDGPIRLGGSETVIPSHWVAGLLKASLLTMFEMIGYRSIRDPLGDTVRSTLAKYFRENGSRADAAVHFRDFHNSVKLLGKGKAPSDLGVNYQPFEFDTLESRMVLLHYLGTDQRLMFAATVIFQINAATITTTIPQSLGGADIATVWKIYQRLMTDERSVDQRVYRAHFKDAHLLVETTPLNVHYVDGREVFESSVSEHPT